MMLEKTHTQCLHLRQVYNTLHSSCRVSFPTPFLLLSPLSLSLSYIWMDPLGPLWNEFTASITFYQLDILCVLYSVQWDRREVQFGLTKKVGKTWLSECQVWSIENYRAAGVTLLLGWGGAREGCLERVQYQEGTVWTTESKNPTIRPKSNTIQQ